MYKVKCKTDKSTMVAFHRNEVSAIVATAETENYLKCNDIKGTVERTKFEVNCDSLILEVGRKCNLECQHCLRGDAQNITMPFEVARTAIDQFDYISSIVFTGGEPSLYGKEINEIVDYIIATDVPIGSFYVATNGVSANYDFIMALMKLYAHCDDKEMCCLDISNDHFHQGDGNYSDSNYFIYEALAFARKKGDIAETYLVTEGRAAEFKLGNRTMKKTAKFSCEYYFAGDEQCIVELVYVNAKGGILPDCDYSYQSQDEMKPYNIDDIRTGKITILDVFEKFNKEDSENERT